MLLRALNDILTLEEPSYTQYYLTITPYPTSRQMYAQI